MKDLFLDCNAHVPINTKALNHFVKLNQSLAGHGHPASITKPGREAANLIEEARNKISELLGAKSANQIIFTHGATQAAQWAIYCFDPLIESIYDTICSPVEHPAVWKAYEYYNLTGNYFSANKNGTLNYPTINHKVGICMHVQNEFGTIYNPLDLPASFKVVDLSQSIGKIPVNVAELDIDIGFGACHKFGGFNSVGFLYFKNTDVWRAFGTGSRQYMDRTGTLDACAISASAIALEEAIKSLPERNEKCKQFQLFIEQGLENLGWEIVAKDSSRVTNTTFAYLPNKALLALSKLNEKNIYAGVGSACGSHMSGLSKSIQALGYQGDAQDFIRISNWDYDLKEAKQVMQVLESI